MEFRRQLSSVRWTALGGEMRHVRLAIVVFFQLRPGGRRPARHRHSDLRPLAEFILGALGRFGASTEVDSPPSAAELLSLVRGGVAHSSLPMVRGLGQDLLVPLTTAHLL